MNRGWSAGVVIGLGAAALGLMASGGLWAHATPAPACCVASVNMGQILQEYQRMKDLDEEFKKVRGELAAEERSRQESLNSLEATVSAMDPEDATFKKRMEEWYEATFNYKVWREMRQAALTRELALATDRCYRDVLRIVEETARNSGYDIVLYHSNYQAQIDPDAIQQQMLARHVVYVSPSADITQAVLSRLNAEYRSAPPTTQLKMP